MPCNLRKLRGSRTQDETSRAIKTKLRTYQSWEQAYANPPIPMLITIARYYHITVDQLIGADKLPIEKGHKPSIEFLYNRASEKIKTVIDLLVDN